MEMKSMLIVAVMAVSIIFLFVLTARFSRPSTKASDAAKKKAQLPPVNKKLLYDEPTCVVLGKHKKKYVCNTEPGSHVFIIGGTGSGKTSTVILPSLLSEYEEDDRAALMARWVLDIKGELVQKAGRFSDRVCVINPLDEDSWGYNPLYGLNLDSSEQDVIERMGTIAISLIPMSANCKETVWPMSARNLFQGLLLYHWFCKGIDEFIDLIDAILGSPVEEQIEEALNVNNRIVNAFLSMFYGTSDSTLKSIQVELVNHLTLFATDYNIRDLLTKESRVDPRVLNRGISIYNVMPEEKLSAYYDLLQLMINQMFVEMEKRVQDNEDNPLNRVQVFIDELPRIVSAGRCEKLVDALRTLRSKGVQIILVAQTLEGLMSAYTDKEVADMISNCRFIEVLSASSEYTQKMIVDWCGKFREISETYNMHGTGTGRSVSYTDKEIVSASELISLPETGKAILISPYGYSKVDKVPYYQDNWFLNRISKKW